MNPYSVETLAVDPTVNGRRYSGRQVSRLLKSPTTRIAKIGFYLNQVPQRGNPTLARNCLDFCGPVFCSWDQMEDWGLRLTAVLASLPRGMASPVLPASA